MFTRSSPLSPVTSFQIQQSLTSNKEKFSKSQVRDPAYALLDSGATHVLLPGHMLRRRARSFEAVGKEKARCWRNEVYAEDRAHPLLPLGRLANLLDTKFIWENGEALMQCRDKGQWRTMTKFEIRNNMAYASQMQFEVLRRALWVQQAQPQTALRIGSSGRKQRETQR